MLLKSGIVVAAFTLLSRIFGLARELIIASMFGTTLIADCINIALKLPNIFRRICGEGALSSIFVPMYSNKLSTSSESAKRFSGEIFVLLLMSLTCLTILLQIFMPYLMTLIAPGFMYNKEKYNLAIILCRITIPYVIFVSVTALFGGMLHSIYKFSAFAFIPIIMSICVVSIPYLLQNLVALHYGIAYSLLIAGIIQVSFMYYCLIKSKLEFMILFQLKDPDSKKLLKKMIPATMSSGLQQLNLFISQSIASFFPGAVSILSYADRIYQLPLSLIGVTFSTILLPELSTIYKNQEYHRANILQNKAIKISLAISIPAMFGLLSLSKKIIHVIYERGEFTSHDTIITSKTICALAFGLPAFILAKILTIIFYANLDTKTPFYVTVCALVINTVSNVLLMMIFGYISIAIGSSISAWINVWLLNKYAKQYGNFVITSNTKKFILQILVCGILMYGFIGMLDYHYGTFFYSTILLMKIFLLFATISCAIIVYIAFAYCLKVHKSFIQS